MVALQRACYLGQLNYIKETGGVTASVTSYPDVNHAENPHYHETFVLSLVLNGGNVEKRKAMDVERTPGTITCHEAGEPHRSTRIRPGSRHVNLELTEQFMKVYDLHTHAAALEKSHSSDARFLMLKIYKELLVDDQHSSLSIESSILNLLHFTNMSCTRSGTPNWVSKITEALHDRWNETFTLNELAEIADMHPANVSGYFPAYFGCTIGEYRRKLKMEKAFELLKSHCLSLTAIAYECGFADQSHFTRTCKQLTGWNPKQLKEMNTK